MSLRDELHGVTPDEATEAFRSFTEKLGAKAKDVAETYPYQGIYQIGCQAIQHIEDADVEGRPARDIAVATMTYVLGTLIEIAESREFAVQFPDMPDTPTPDV